jgi:putative spermidine/putrescine transport system permease protein
MSAATSVAAPRLRRRGASGTAWWWLLLPAAALLGVCFAYPLASLLAQSFDGSEDNYSQLWDSTVFHTVLLRTFTTSAIVCGVCLVLGYPYAYLMTVVGRGWRNLMLIVVLVPFWTSLMVRTFAWLVLLQDNGVVNDGLAAVGFGRLELIRNTTGVTIGMAQVMLPFAVLPMYAVMQKIDRRLLQAAEGCGARPATAFARIYVPLSLPGVLAGMTIVFVISLGFFITPQLLGSPSDALVSQLLYTQVTQLGNWGYAAAMGFVLLASTLILLLLVQGGMRTLGARRGSAGAA